MSASVDTCTVGVELTYLGARILRYLRYLGRYFLSMLNVHEPATF